MSSIPNRFTIVQAVDAAHPHLIRQNTRETCREFLWRTVEALARQDPKFGFLSKLPAENHVEIPGAGRVSIDAIAYQGEHNVVDIIGSAGDGVDPATGQTLGRITWGESDQRRPSSVWVAAVPFGDAPPVPPRPPQAPPGTDWEARFAALQQEVSQAVQTAGGAYERAGQAVDLTALLAERIGRLKLVPAPELPDEDAVSTNSVGWHAHRIKARITG